jgi:hypothetical protein
MNPETSYYYSIWMLLAQVALGTMLLPIIAALRHLKKFNPALKVFVYFLIAHLFIAIGEQVVYWLMVQRNPYILAFLRYFSLKTFNFYEIFFILKDFTLLGYFFYLLLIPRPKAKWVLWVSYSLLTAILVNYFFIEKPDAYGSFNSTSLAFFNFTLPIIYMWILYHGDSKIPLSKNPYFWINVGLIIPNLLSIFLYFAGEKIQTTDLLLYTKIMIGRSIIEMISQILFTIGFAYGRYAQFLR